MRTGKYSFINGETIVSPVLSGIGNASGHPVRWSITVKMCLLPDVDVSHIVMRSNSNFIEWSIWYFCHLQRVMLDFGFLPLAKYTICNVFPNILVHTLPVILSFY